MEVPFKLIEDYEFNTRYFKMLVDFINDLTFDRKGISEEDRAEKLSLAHEFLENFCKQTKEADKKLLYPVTSL